MYENLAQKAREGRVSALASTGSNGSSGALRSGRNTANPQVLFQSRRHNSGTVLVLR